MRLRLLKRALQKLFKRPGLSVLSVVILGLGFAPLVASWTLWSRLEGSNRVFAKDTRLCSLGFCSKDPRKTSAHLEMPTSLLPTLREDEAFQHLCAVRSDCCRVPFLSQKVPTLWVEPALFNLLDTVRGKRVWRAGPSFQGRTFTVQDASPGAAPVAMVTERGWRRHFHHKPDVIGQWIEMDKEMVQLVGLLKGPLPGSMDACDFLLPLGKTGLPLQSASHRCVGGVGVFVYLTHGWQREQITAHLQPLSDDLARQLPAFQGYSLAANTLEHRADKKTLLLLLALGLPTFLVSCASVAALILAQDTSRQGEMAIFVVLGAGRRRLLLENLLPTLLLCFMALLLAAPPAMALQNRLLPEAPAQGIDIRLYLELSMIILLGALTTGLVPAWKVMRGNLWAALGKGYGTTPKDTRKGWPRVLASLQFGLSLMLRGCASLIWRHYQKIAHTEPYPHWRHVVSVGQLRKACQTTLFSPAEVGEEHLKLAALPGVKRVSVGFSPILPTDSFTSSTLICDSQGREWRVCLALSENSLLEVMGLKLLGGRLPQSPGEVVISTVLAEKCGGAETVLGQAFTFSRPGKGSPPTLTVVGISESPRDLEKGGVPVPWMMMWPSHTMSAVTLQLHRNDPVSRQALRQALEDRYQREITFLVPEEMADCILMPFRYGAKALGGLGLLALALGLAGLTGLTHLMVARRTREMGLRMALGATRGAVVRQVLWESLKLVIIGLPFGLLMTWVCGRMIQRKWSHWHFDGLQPAWLLLVIALMLLAVVLATLVPALRAAQTNPADVLRAE